MKVEWEAGKYRSRDFPFSPSVIEYFASLLPAEDTAGLSCTISDADLGAGSRPSQTLGQYIISASKRIRSGRNPEGLIRLYTLQVRYLKRGPVYTTHRDYRSWVREDMIQLMRNVVFTLYHEVGHYVYHKERPDHSAGPVCEAAADGYAMSMMSRAESLMEKEIESV